MKARTRTILAICFAIVMFKDFGTAIGISSKIDLNSDESKETLSNADYYAITSPNESADPSGSVLRIHKLPTFSWRSRGSELVKSSEPRKRKIYASRDNDSQLKIINNIQIIINGNDSTPTVKSCENSACNISVSSKLDGKGNIVTDVHLSIITNLKPDMKVDDVPVIESFRGINNDHDRPPILNSIRTPIDTIRSYLHRDNIPQIQNNYQDYDESWYQRQRTFQRPQIYRNRYHFGDRRSMGLRGSKTWPQSYGPIVDDKIAPPLSKTNSERYGTVK